MGLANRTSIALQQVSPPLSHASPINKRAFFAGFFGGVGTAKPPRSPRDFIRRVGASHLHFRLHLGWHGNLFG